MSDIFDSIDSITDPAQVMQSMTSDSGICTPQDPSTPSTSSSPQSFKVFMTDGQDGMVRFEASSPISESRVANYEGYNIVHLPTSLWAYRNTNGRHFSITGRMVSRNPNEATANAGYLTTIRSWVLPGFGATGSTPPIIFLSGYSNNQINAVPCVVLSYSWTFPDDVDYIWSTDEPMPVIGIISIELEEAYSAQQITSGAWKIKTQKGGSFSYTGVTGSSSSSDPLDFNPNSLFAPGFKGLAAGGLLGSSLLGGLLSPSAISQLPTMAAKIIGAATNSPVLSQVALQGGELLNNTFVSGASVSGLLNNINSPPAPVAAAESAVSSVFGRGVSLPIPSFFGG